MILRLLLRGAQRLRCIDGWAATSPFLLRQRTRVYELTARQVVDFLWARLPAQNGVAMRMTTEAANYVSMSTRLRHRVLQYPAQLRRRLFRELLRELDRTLQVQELLGMPQGQKEEGLLPGSFESREVTNLQSLERECEGFLILCERPRCAFKNRA